MSIPSVWKVTASADGRNIVVDSESDTVDGVLAEAGVAVGPRERVRVDRIVASSSTPLPGTLNTTTAVAAAMVQPRITVDRARWYGVFIDELRLEVQSPASNVAELIAALGLVLREADLVEPLPETALTAGTTVRLPAARTVNVILDGEA